MLAFAGEAAAEISQNQVRQQQEHHHQSVSQLSVTGVSLAVMSRRHALAAPPAASVAPGTAAASTFGSSHTAAAPPTSSTAQVKQKAAAMPSTAAASDLAAVLTADGWRECHVLLRQWQCTIALSAVLKGSRGSSGAAAQAAQAHQDTGGVQDKAPPAIVIRYQTAGLSEVSHATRHVRSWAPVRAAATLKVKHTVHGAPVVMHVNPVAVSIVFIVLIFPLCTLCAGISGLSSSRYCSELRRRQQQQQDG